jgi:hypothetical protein
VKVLGKINKKYDWFTIVNQITTICLSKIRDGEQIVWLNDSVGFNRPEYLVHPLFIKNNPNIIYADRSSAKSLFMNLISIMLSLGVDAYGLYIGKEHNVLFLDWENDPETTGWQRNCLLKGFGFSNFETPYLHLSQPLAKCLPQIQKKISEVNADTAIIDSLGVAVGGNLNDSEPAMNFFSALRQLPITPLIIAHTAKDKNNPHKTVYGNAFYENLSRSIWEASKLQSQGAKELKLSLYQRKTPPFNGYQNPLGFRFLFKGDVTEVESCDPENNDNQV